MVMVKDGGGMVVQNVVDVVAMVANVDGMVLRVGTVSVIVGDTLVVDELDVVEVMVDVVVSAVVDGPVCVVVDSSGRVVAVLSPPDEVVDVVDSGSLSAWVDEVVDSGPVAYSS